MKGDPKRSMKMLLANISLWHCQTVEAHIDTNTRKPKPINSADPHGRACGAAFEGHSIKSPVSGREAQGPDPPAQLFMPASEVLAVTSAAVLALTCN